jgi:hypothetical protein
MSTQHTTRLCSLAAAAGRPEACPEAACPFWEPGGAALVGRCAFEELDVVPDAAVGTWLLEVREKLEAASSAEERRTLRGVFHHLLNDSFE